MKNIKELAELIEKQTLERLRLDGINYEGFERNAKVNVIPGNKYTKINVGSSGKYMIDSDGNIFGIKAYGVIHRGHYYGTLETINDYYWGNYTASKIKKQLTEAQTVKLNGQY